MPLIDAGGNAPGNLLLGGGHERRIASQAAGERRHQGGQVEAFEHLAELKSRVRLAEPVTVGDGGPHQKAAVARQQNAPLGGGQSRQITVAEVMAIDRVEAYQAQVRGQATQVRIGKKADLTQRLGTDSEHRRDVNGLEDRIDADAVAVAKRPTEVDAFAVHQDEIHLGVRHAQALDGLLDRDGSVKGVGKRAAALGRRQEIVQFRIEAKSGRLDPVSTIAG